MWASCGVGNPIWHWSERRQGPASTIQLGGGWGGVRAGAAVGWRSGWGGECWLAVVSEAWPGGEVP